MAHFSAYKQFIQRKMDNQIDSIEEMMKPTKKHRGIFLTCFFCIVVVQLLTGYQLYRTAESYNVRLSTVLLALVVGWWQKWVGHQ